MAAVQDSMSRFILKWAGANTVGWLAAAVLALPFLLLYQPLHKGIAGAAIGIGLGAGQWLLMRHYLEKAGWWIVVTVVGFAVGGALMGFGTTEELSKRGLSRRRWVSFSVQQQGWLNDPLSLATLFEPSDQYLATYEEGYGTWQWAPLNQIRKLNPERANDWRRPSYQNELAGKPMVSTLRAAVASLQGLDLDTLGDPSG